MAGDQTKAETAKRPVVVLREYSGEARRHLLRLLPASMVSVGAHVLLFLLFFLFTAASPSPAVTDAARVNGTIEAELTDEIPKRSFATDDFDPSVLEPGIDINYPVDRIDKISVPGDPDPAAKVGGIGGKDDAPPVSIPAPGGYGKSGLGGSIDTLGKGNSKLDGPAGGYNERGLPLIPGGINSRSGATRDFALRAGGGTDASEAAVGRGLRWLVRQQMPDGRWMLNSPNLPDRDRGAEANDIAATALGLLPFLAAGKTHKPDKDNSFDKTVDKGLKFLLRSQNKDGYFGVSMYAHGLATIAVCEAFGLSQDPLLRRPAQNAVNLLINTQHETGGWRYSPTKQPGDMSISGWQIMAIKSAQMAGLDVPTVTVVRAKSFLNSCANADEGYGYVAGGGSSPRMTAVALLCRQYMDNWGPSHPRMIKAIDRHIKTNSPDRQDVYYYYYATQVMHHFGGEAWRDWNEKMREALIQKQDGNAASANFGSWSPAGDPYGRAGGRLMMTSLNLLTLEVYYRYLPLYYRDAGYKLDDAVKKAL